MVLKRGQIIQYTGFDTSYTAFCRKIILRISRFYCINEGQVSWRLIMFYLLGRYMCIYKVECKKRGEIFFGILSI